MSKFEHKKLLYVGHDKTEYIKIADNFGAIEKLGNRQILNIKAEQLKMLAHKAFYEIMHFLRSEHLEQLKKITLDSEASDNDKFVAESLLENAVIAAAGIYPGCQDTGTAIVWAKKGENVFVEGDDEQSLTEGIYNAYKEHNFRYSQVAAIDMVQEKNTGTNLPAQIDIYSQKGSEYHFLFMAKGGGSANKNLLFQQTKALLNEKSLIAFFTEKLKSLGTAACPPYHLAVVIGGTSADYNLKMVKLASAHYLDNLPTTGENNECYAYRDLEWEQKILKITQELGIGAQFGGKYFCHDVRVIRLPRHGASCPVGIGVSCSADRQIKAKITEEGIFLEKLDHHPENYISSEYNKKSDNSISIDLNLGIDHVRSILTKYPIKTRVMLNGSLVVARDIAHAKIQEKLDRGEELPSYFKEKIIYYAGPAKTPKGEASGSFGPTTAQRMDSYLPNFMSRGGSLVMLAKGNRTSVVRESCQKYGGFYLGSVGGPAAQLGKNCITKVKVIDFEELGMEAVFEIEVKDFPAFIIIDDKGNDFFKNFEVDSGKK